MREKFRVHVSQYGKLTVRFEEPQLFSLFERSMIKRGREAVGHGHRNKASSSS